MGHKAVYLASLQLAIRESYGCSSIHVETVRVHHVSGGATIFNDDVEVFGLKGHPEARLAYAWSCLTKDQPVMIVLGMPPVYSAESAVLFKLTAGGPGEPGALTHTASS